ncbi:MAG: putative ribosome quality control (RQC) complex YloA/Tae2 family protein, partial [Myxococcota bacterium]
VGVTVTDGLWLTLSLTRGGASMRLTVQFAGRYLNVGVFGPDDEELVRLIHGARAVDPDARPLRGEAAAPTSDGFDSPETALAWLDAFAEASWASVDARGRAATCAVLRRATKQLAKKAARSVQALEKDLVRAEGAVQDRHRGELLKTRIGQVPAKATSIAIPDWTQPDMATTVVPLDPALSDVENMARLFKRYRKYANAVDGIETRLLTAVEHEDGLADVSGAIAILAADADDVSTDADEFAARVSALWGRLSALGFTERSTAKPAKGSTGKGAAVALPYHRFEAADGTAILVGKGARHNDALTFRVARGSDIWLHARDFSGSHVVLVWRQPTSPPTETLLDAASLAAWHSKARGEAIIDVMWTQRKHVRRAPGGSAGRVTTGSNHNVAVRAEPVRLERLYATRGTTP